MVVPVVVQTVNIFPSRALKKPPSYVDGTL